MLLQAHDTVFTQVAAHLHLDQLQGNLARVFQCMHCAHGQVNRCVLGQQTDLTIQRHADRAAPHNPMLGAVVVHLHPAKNQPPAAVACHIDC